MQYRLSCVEIWLKNIIGLQKCMTSVVNCQNLIHQLHCEQQTVIIYHRQYFHVYSIHNGSCYV